MAEEVKKAHGTNELCQVRRQLAIRGGLSLSPCAAARGARIRKKADAEVIVFRASIPRRYGNAPRRFFHRKNVTTEVIHRLFIEPLSSQPTSASVENATPGERR